MVTSPNSFPKYERIGFAAALFGVCALLFLVGLIPHSERALFIKDDSRVPAKAFSAVVPPLDAAQTMVERSLLNNAAKARANGPGGTKTNSQSLQLAATDPKLLAGTLPTLLSTGNAPGITTPGDAAPADGTAPVLPDGQQPVGTTPTTTTSNPPAAPGLPAPTAGAPAVAAVPEPATWAMMLLGFFAIGAAVRRRPRATTLVSEHAASVATEA